MQVERRETHKSLALAFGNRIGTEDERARYLALVCTEISRLEAGLASSGDGAKQAPFELGKAARRIARNLERLACDLGAPSVRTTLTVALMKSGYQSAERPRLRAFRALLADMANELARKRPRLEAKWLIGDPRINFVCRLAADYEAIFGRAPSASRGGPFHRITTRALELARAGRYNKQRSFDRLIASAMAQRPK